MRAVPDHHRWSGLSEEARPTPLEAPHPRKPEKRWNHIDIAAEGLDLDD